jgi:serine/threonine-protein kinase
MSPSRIAGRYELQEQLGEGGMGVVWRALDIKTGSAVAIKLMKDISDPVAVDLFTKEWKALAEISHPNIVEVRDVDVIEENRQKRPFFVMPLLRGATLADLIANASARLTLERIVEITVHVCRGLQAAHERGLVHRDLKPSNIFVMADDTAKIIDFGVVHLAGSKSVTGQKGTFQYMSPEQAQLRAITPASDLFSMGVILYEALTRRKPFVRNTVDETMEAVIKFIPPPVSEINPSINQSVSKVVHKCLAKQAIHRFASARELAETLQKAARNEPVFDATKIEPRIERAKAAFKSGDEVFASEILAELEAEGQLDPRITVLRMQIELTVKQKKIRQLLESARARIEQDEIPLALDKIREVLELDPQNPDALAMREAMEKQRSEAQITKWLELAQTHLSNRDFGAARNAAQEVLAIRSADTRALDLLEKIESTETDAKRVRDQKEQLYSSALRAYQDGEIEAALSKLERLFSVARANPSAAIPERDAVYQSFYKEVRSERDSIHSALEDAQRQFSEKNFPAAMAVCRELLAKYPNDGTFQALKIRIEDAERQELSSYIADVSKRLEAEPDLDRRVNIVREACERYPNEVQFAQQLKLIRERRDLVNSIVAKARQYEERAQYAEAISQWDILRNIHPHYPGIGFELEQCKKKRDRQVRDEEHSRQVQEIDGLMEGRAYAKAIECASAALLEFPGDAELSGLRTLAEQGLERTKESRRLFEEGQQALAEKDLGRATELLRASLNLDPRGPGLRDAVVKVLTERARTLAEENWRDAEPLYQEASELDATHPAVRALRSSITEAKRQALVGQCLVECRSLVAAGKPHEAAERIRAARAEYPNDARLEQYEGSLQREVNEVRRKEERGRDQAALGENHRLAEQNPDRAKLRAVLENSYAIRAKHPDDPEIGRTVAEIELTVKRAAKVEDLSELLSMETVRTGTDGRGAVVPKPRGGPTAPRVEEKRGPRLVDKSAERTKLFEPERKVKENKFQILVGKAEMFAADVERRVLAFARPAGKWSAARLGAVSGILILLAVIAYFVFRPPVQTKEKVEQPQPARSVQITTDPPDSVVTSQGNPIANGTVTLGTTIEVNHLGYKTRQVQIQQDSDGKVALEPEPAHLSIHTSETGGSVELDGQKISDLTDGSLDEYELPANGATHKVSVMAQGKPLFTVEVQVPAGSQPRVTALDASDLFAITSLGSHATLYGGNQLRNARIGDQKVAVTASGTDITLSDQDSELFFGQGNNQGSVSIEISNAPALMVQSLNAEGQVLITTSADKAALTVDGLPVPRGKRGWMVRRPPGLHTFTMSAEGHETQTWTMTMQRRQALNKHVELISVRVTPLMAALVVTGGTPGAAVAIDSTRVGSLDSAGNFQLPNALAVGRHSVSFLKPDYETRVYETTVNPSSAGKPLAEIQISKPLLSPFFGTLAFEVTARDVTVKYRRVGESQFREVNSLQKIQLPPGQYEIECEPPGYKRSSAAVNLGRESVTVPLKLVPIPDYEFENPDQIAHEGEWLRAKVPGKFINLRAGRLHQILVFARPGKTLFWNKKVEWQIEDPVHHARVLYALESQSGKLTRKLVVGQEPSEQYEAKVDAQSAGQPGSLSLHVSVEGGRVRISNDKGARLDEFTAREQDFSKGRIAIRTDSLFLVRSDNQ